MKIMFLQFEYFFVIMSLLLFVIRDSSPITYKVEKTLIPKDASLVLKAILCIVIVLHHFGRRHQEILLLKVFGLFGGFISVALFFVLSSYGIVKSEKICPSTNIRYFIKKRFSKLLIPLWIITLLTIIVYYVIGANNLTNENLDQAKINPYFLLIGQHKLRIIDYLSLFVSITRLDGVLWYCVVLFYSYFSFYFAKSLFPIQVARTRFVITYLFFIGAFFFYSIVFNLEPAYYIYLWCLVFGTILACYEVDIMKSRKPFLLVFMLFDVFYIPFYFYFNNFAFLVCVNISIIVLFVVYKYCNRFYLKQGGGNFKIGFAFLWRLYMPSQNFNHRMVVY